VTAGEPNPSGACCSEWVACAQGLTCEAGDAFPGASGTCVGPAPACSGGGAEGECCSEWIPCAAGLTCKANGPVYPGSSGVCSQE
jgi:hypothetical protein